MPELCWMELGGPTGSNSSIERNKLANIYLQYRGSGLKCGCGVRPVLESLPWPLDQLSLQASSLCPNSSILGEGY